MVFNIIFVFFSMAEIVLNPFKRSVGRPSTRGVGRPKATFQGSDFQPRRSGLTKEALMAATARQSIEPLNMSDFDRSFGLGNVEGNDEIDGKLEDPTDKS
uniref:Histone-lysine N-methyltransferase SET9 n=1 Tax=Lygus hesperus TaxID=30085 RepID=A0A0A9WIY8_LYGHE